MRPEPILILFLILLALGYFLWERGTRASASRWRTRDALDAIRRAGLPMENIHEPGDRPWLPLRRPDVVFFHIPTPGGTGNCYIFSLTSALQAEQLWASSGGPRPTTPNMTALTFTHGNLYITAFGNLAPETLQAYEAAIRTLSADR